MINNLLFIIGGLCCEIHGAYLSFDKRWLIVMIDSHGEIARPCESDPEYHDETHKSKEEILR